MTAAILGLVVIQASVLFWRRTQPVLVLLASVVTTIVAFAITPDREPGTPALIFAVYAVSVYGPSRLRLWVAVGAIALLVGAVGFLLVSQFDAARKVLPAGATAVVAWVIGDFVRSRRMFFLDLVSRNRQEREQAAETERLRIARELHDVVAHNVSVIAIQAGAARVSAADNDDALASIEKSARDTLAELNKLLGVLRKDPSAPPLAPQPSLEDVDALLKPARDAGIDATIKVTGDKRTLPVAVDLSAYRIVQEAVTNVLKHSGASRVEVAVDYGPSALTVAVSDNGNGGEATGSRGHGLIGMRERVALFGGDLSTGSTSLGGFTVKATLPVKT